MQAAQGLNKPPLLSRACDLAFWRSVSAESVALIPTCAECEALWLPADEERWQTTSAATGYLDAPGEVVFYRPECAEGEFVS